ncbi:GbsR/MarR family transcriptional regulator [Agromyces sp. Marseille-P2726]|uniref:GbsR/MarR family transcriptional regulator n=1 Tax=Agromyces sp. Marseille-P2726 TaxID=2709132 RepID=UPI001570E465|nr:MarR family transcriptional regulator [Agromyces sp. Marseille-P2726]
MPERDERAEFIESVGDALAAWRLSRATGRLYGHLLLSAEPMTFDDIGRALGMSTGGVSTAVRELVSWGLARTIPQPGSRRLRVEAVGGFEQLLAASHERTRNFIRTLRAGESLTDDARTNERLRSVTELFERYVDAGDEMLRRHRRAR